MKKTVKIALLLMAATLIATGCSRKGVHMSKHRKSRKCNCPTFSENNPISNQPTNYIFLQHTKTES